MDKKECPHIDHLVNKKGKGRTRCARVARHRPKCIGEDKCEVYKNFIKVEKKQMKHR